MKCPYGPDAICSECDDTSQICHPEHGKRDMELKERVKKLEAQIEELKVLVTEKLDSDAEILNRLFQLEEKERQRAREQYDREIRIDYDATKHLDSEEGKDRDQFMFEGVK